MTRSEGRNEDLLEGGEDAVAVHRAIKHARRGETGNAEPGDEGAGAPMDVRSVIGPALAAQHTAVPAQPRGGAAAFIKEDQSRRIMRRRVRSPVLPGGGDGGPIFTDVARRDVWRG